MSLASALKSTDLTRRRKKFRVAITPSGNYATGGDTLDLTAMTNPTFQPAGFFGGLPDSYGAINSPGGYDAEFIPGTTLANGKIKFYSAGGTELAAGAYPAALTSDPLIFEFSGPIGQI